MELNIELYQISMAILFVGIVLLLHLDFMVKRHKEESLGKSKTSTLKSLK